MEIESIERKAHSIREHIVNTVINNGDGHAGPSLSATDILASLYFKVLNVRVDEPDWAERDRFVLSAGHKCLGLYGTLIEKGFEKKEVLASYNCIGCAIPGHPDMEKFTGVDFSTGALGHGLPIGSGMAVAAKRRGHDYRVFVLMGDGEQGEGSNWEAAMFASHHKLDNLVGIIDRNGLQINGSTSEVLETDLGEKYRAFGWSVKEVDGHDIQELLEAFQSLPFESGKPSMIIANTIKSKGMPFAEGNVKYHHWNPGKGSKEAEAALEALEKHAKEKGWTK